MVESLPADAGDTGSCPGLGRSHVPRRSWVREPRPLSLRVRSLCSAVGGAAVVRGPRTAKNKKNLPANAEDTASSPGMGRSHMPRSGWAREPWPLSLRVRSLCSATGEATAVRGPRTGGSWVGGKLIIQLGADMGTHAKSRLFTSGQLLAM